MLFGSGSHTHTQNAEVIIVSFSLANNRERICDLIGIVTTIHITGCVISDLLMAMFVHTVFPMH